MHRSAWKGDFTNFAPRVLGYSAHRRTEDGTLPLLRNPRDPLLLATAIHVVGLAGLAGEVSVPGLVGHVMVPALAAVEFVPLPVESVEKIFAIPAAEHALVLTPRVGVGLIFAIQVVIACPSVKDVAAWSSPDHVVALVAVLLVIGAAHQEVVAWPAVEGILIAEAAYLVVAFHSVQLFGSVGACERFAYGAAGHVVRDQGAQVARSV